MSLSETQAMEEYIRKAHVMGFIYPYTSPMTAGIFFVEKKDRELRPCIDYRELNAIMVRYP